LISDTADNKDLDTANWTSIVEPVQAAMKAIPLLETALSKDGGNPSICGLLGALLVVKTFFARDHEPADGTLDTAAIEKLSRGGFQLSEGMLDDLAKGRTLLEKSDKISPARGGELYYYMALADFCAGNSALAEKNLGRMLELKKNDRRR